jgi:xylan 1,4-beta-xylosidase
VRQSFHQGVFSVSLAFDPVAEKDEAGISCYMNPNFHYDLFIRKNEGRRELVSRRHVSDIEVFEKAVSLDSEWVDIEVRINPWAYKFYVATEGREPELFVKMQAQLITRSVAGGFTGVILSLFASGNSASCQPPARFKNIKARETEKVIPPHKT